MRKTKKVFLLLLVLITVLLAFIGVRVFAGFYPLPDLVYKLYYANQNDKERLSEVEIDDNFAFYEEGYSVLRKVSSPYPLPHFLILHFNSTVPMEIESKLRIKLEIYRKDKLIFSEILENGYNVFERDIKGKPVGVCAISITELPFPLKWKSYKNLTVEIKVLNADEALHKYVHKASLILSPDITL